MFKIVNLRNKVIIYSKKSFRTKSNQNRGSGGGDYPPPINCSDCKSFISLNGRCGKFNYMDEAKLVHEFAFDCRADEEKCGFFAKHFVDRFSIPIEKTI